MQHRFMVASSFWVLVTSLCVHRYIVCFGELAAKCDALGRGGLAPDTHIPEYKTFSSYSALHVGRR